MCSPWGLMGAYSLFLPSPLKPAITYGEFPFELVYTMEGETIVINDIYVCEFAGFTFNEATLTKFRSWVGYVKSTGEDHIILKQDENIQLICTVGCPEYYMKDPDYISSPPVPKIMRISSTQNGISIGGERNEVEALMKQFQIELVSWVFSEPINNSYK